MQHYEPGLTQIRIVQHGFEQQRIDAADVEVSARAGVGVQMHGHAQPPAFGGDVAEQKILEWLVFGFGRRALRPEPRVDGFGRAAVDLVELERSQIRRLELFRHRAARALTLQRRRHHARQVFAQCRRHSF